MGVLAVLLVIEILVDKIPAVDSINDTIQTLVRPAAGAILFAAGSGVISETHPILTMICGLLVAGGVHSVKATARPVITGTTGGLLNPVISTAEDVVSLILAVLSIVIPVLALVLLLLLIIWFISRRARRLRKHSATW